jgi:hypothetical protein
VFFNFTVFSQIQGQNPVCQYQSGVQYYYVSAQPIQWAVWNVPQGSTIVSTSINSFYIGNVRWFKAILVVNFGNAAVSGNILLNIKIQLYDAFNATFAVNVISTSSTNGNVLTGINNVYTGSSYTYSVPLDSNVTSYQWILPTGAIGASTTNSISVTYSINSVSGYLIVKRLYSCGMITDTYLPITVNPALGLNQIQKDNFVYYPNPVNNVVNFENNYTIKKITLFNLLCQRVEEKEINSLSGQLDMSKLPTGNYLLMLKTENGESTVKLVKN